MTRRAMAVVLAFLATGCARTGVGLPVAGDTGSSSPPPPSALPTTKADATAAPGVLPTARAPIRPGTVTCSPPLRPAVAATAEVTDPSAPRITVAVPDGWSASPGSGDIGARLNGPDGMWATVSIAVTQHDPAATFRQYVDRLVGDSALSSVSVLPAALCGYSGQKLLGALAYAPQAAVEFRDRIVDVWTNTQTYLVAIHVQAPTDVPGFDAPATQLTVDFEVRIP